MHLAGIALGGLPATGPSPPLLARLPKGGRHWRQAPAKVKQGTEAECSQLGAAHTGCMALLGSTPANLPRPHANFMTTIKTSFQAISHRRTPIPSPSRPFSL